jgi:HD-GYP domain-containing protein (c-di-GMP phosphodiesterase class II)
MSKKRIPVSSLTTGMYLDGIESGWLNHDLWKTHFLIEDELALQRVRSSGVSEVWIDTARGVDLPDQPDIPRLAPAPPRPVVIPKPAKPPSISLADEMQAATAIHERSLKIMASLLVDARMGRSIDTARCTPVVNAVIESVQRNGDALESLTRLKHADDYTYQHSIAVCALMVSLGRRMGFSDDECREAGLAGLLLDFGKLSVPPEVMNKPGKLTVAEQKLMRLHSAQGSRMLQEAGVTSEWVLDVAHHHHERMDGLGYPDRLSGPALSQIARMGAICDVYDAITSNRPYRRGCDPAESLAQMIASKGQFDPDVLMAFVATVGIYPTGSLVRLASGRLAVVLEQNPQRLTAPRVKVFFSTNGGVPLRPEVVDLALIDDRDRIEARENPGKWRFGFLNSLWAGDAEIALALDEESAQRAFS